MIDFIKRHVPALIIACLLTAMPAAVKAENHTDATGIAYKTEFRQGKSAWNKHTREGRVILDEMVANKGADNTLEEFNWTTLADRAAFAEHWIKQQDKAEFNDVLRQLTSTRDELDFRAGHIQDLRYKIFTEQKTRKAHWDQLLVGDSIQDHLLKALGIEVAGKIGSELFGWLGEKISNKVGSLLAKGAGKAIGPISTIASLYEFFSAYGDYAEMKLMLDRLLERAEMIAYLDVLLKKYDGVIAAQEKIIAELEEAYAARANSKCQ